MVTTTRRRRVDDNRAPRPNLRRSPVIDPPLGTVRVDLWMDWSRDGVV